MILKYVLDNTFFLISRSEMAFIYVININLIVIDVRQPGKLQFDYEAFVGCGQTCMGLPKVL